MIIDIKSMHVGASLSPDRIIEYAKVLVALNAYTECIDTQAQRDLEIHTE
jgi:hypothetical protein